MNALAIAETQVLIVEPDLMRTTALNHACNERGLRVIVARDLPTALLTISQHLFDACLIAATIQEQGDGWALAAVCRLIFPEAYIGVVASDRSLLTLQSAINNGVDEVFESTGGLERITAALAQLLRHGENPRRQMN